MVAAWARAPAARCARDCRARLLRFAGMPLVRSKSADRIPAGQCVIVANHASYLDGLVMTAALPPRFGFVIKREMARVPLAGTASAAARLAVRRALQPPPRRCRCAAAAAHGVERAFAGVLSGRNVLAAAGTGEISTGAFAIAARAGCPVVPAVMRGTRHALPPKTTVCRSPSAHRDRVPASRSSRRLQRAEDAAMELRDRARCGDSRGAERAGSGALCKPSQLRLTCSAGTARPPRRARARSGPASRPSPTPSAPRTHCRLGGRLLQRCERRGRAIGIARLEGAHGGHLILLLFLRRADQLGALVLFARIVVSTRNVFTPTIGRLPSCFFVS